MNPHLPLGRNDGMPPDLLDEAPDLFAALTEIGTPRTYARNTIIVTEGERAESVYAVLEGELQVYADDASGKLVELNRLGPGHYFGELCLSGSERCASVRTVRRSRLCSVPREHFARLIAARPELSYHVMHTLIGRVRALTGSVRDLALTDVYGRVANLLRAATPDCDGTRVVRGLSQQDIADRVGASRSMINRVMQDLEAGGYVKCTRGSIHIVAALPKKW